MKKQIVLAGLLSCGMIAANTVYAYGSSSRAPSCKKPVVNVLTPQKNAQVAPGAAFSFEVSSDAREKEIRVEAKKIPVSIAVSTLPNGKYQVDGQLPAELTEGYASIKLTAPGASGKCSAVASVLVKF